jgi:hypothetical protein
MIWKKLSKFFLISTFLFFALDTFFKKYIGGGQFLFPVASGLYFVGYTQKQKGWLTKGDFLLIIFMAR